LQILFQGGKNIMFNNNDGMFMPVAPAYGGGYGGGNGFLGGDGIWALLIFALIFNGGFGGFGGFGGGYGAMMGMGMADGWGLYPWLNNSEHISDGFRDQQLSTQVGNIQNSITSGFGDVQTALCGGFAGVNAAITNAQMANLERSFAAQTASTQGMNGLAMNLQNCCCENRAGIADLKYTVATENCADRAASAQNTQSIITAITAGIQSIKDDLCADRLDAERRENQNLRTQLSMAQLAASQTAQTAELRQSGATQLNNLVSELRACPLPAQPVYGNQPIFTCTGNNSGCGCNGSFYN
jgi:hypothetical protein